MRILLPSCSIQGFPGCISGKEPPGNAGDLREVGSIPGLGRSPGGRNGHPPQYSCLENPVERRVWWATVLGVTEGWTRLKSLSTHSVQRISAAGFLFKYIKYRVIHVSWKKSYDKPRQSIKNRDITLPTQVHIVKAMGFQAVVFRGCESYIIRKAECQRIDAFQLRCWRRLLRVPWTANRY